jgi:asparaginyl-tRNA synthetase
MTSRHLAEFWMLEAEWAFVNQLRDVTSVVEGVLKAAYKSVDGGEDMEVLWKEGNDEKRRSLEDGMRIENAWPRITYTEAMEELKRYHETKGSAGFAFAPIWGQSLKSEHERWLSEQLVGGPVFVTDYPAETKPFYMRRHNLDDRVVECFDLLVPLVGELVGGSLREERVDRLDAAMERCNMGKEDYGWYLDTRKYGGAPHGGFGIGFERLVGWLGGIENVRECIAMPRWAGRMLL